MRPIANGQPVPGASTKCARLTSPAPAAPPARTARGHLGHGRPDWERADLAAQCYEQRRSIEKPTLASLAAAYRVSVAAVQRRRKPKPKPPAPPSLAEQLRTASPAERVEAARALGVDEVWDTMVMPLVSAAAE
jgi:hypothetical protein